MNTRRSMRNKPANTDETLEIVQESNTRKSVSSKFDSESSDSDNEPLKTPQPDINTSKNRKRAANSSDGSSSDSSVGDYLKNPDDIDLGSSFFRRIDKSEKPADFDSIEKNIFGGIQNTLSDSDESEDAFINKEEITKEEPMLLEDGINFTQLHEYNRKLEETKACVQNYENKATKPEKKLDITQLLSVGEKNTEVLDSVKSEAESDDEIDWQEIEEREEKPAETIKIPKEGVQITLAMPVAVKKKKDIDLMAVIKRRINRIKKENQVYIHKVHLLCWIAHGNFINGVLNDEHLLGSALSLIPSEKCYPPKHADISYLEQIVKWYGNIMKLEINLGDVKSSPGIKSLQEQMSKKIALSKRDFVFIFIIILRSLGLQCRLVLSLQTVPIRPLNSELCSLTTKEDSKKSIKKDEPSTSKSSNKLNTSKTNSKLNKSKTSAIKTKTTSKITKNNKSSVKKLETNNKNKEINKVDLSKFIAQSLKDKKINDVSNTIKNTATSLAIKNEEKNIHKSSAKKKIDHKKDPEVKNEIKRNSSSRNKKTTDTSSQNPSVSSKKISDIQNEECTSDIKKEVSRTSRNSTKAKTSSSSSGITKKTSQKPSSSTKHLDTKIENKSTIPDKKSRKSSASSQMKLEDKTTRASTRLVKKDRNVAQIDDEGNEIFSTKTYKRKIIKDINISQLDGADDEPSTSKQNLFKIKKPESASSNMCISKHHPRKAKTEKSKYIDYDSESEFQSSSSSKSPSKRKDVNDNKRISIKKSTPGAKIKLDVRNDIISLIKGSMSEQRHTEKRKSWNNEESDYDSEYESKPITKKRRSIKKTSSEDDFKIKINTKVKQRVKPRSQLDNRVLSTDSDASNTDKKKKGNDVWMEVFLEAEEKWISVDVIKGQVHCISELHSRASQPISYILAWNNNFSLKDVTARYCPNWNTVTRKLRIDSNWWHASLKPYIGIKTARDREEDEDFARQQLDKPLPKTINEYKNHPLYALKRHLLKFEAIYPPDSVTLGFVRGEAVYARECVHTLHSREIWVKHAKVVKPKQEPYKIVKARPKYDKLTGNTIADLPLEIFGKWQVADYVPPTAENGVVPRNAFGNVELFKACMLPNKTVHLQLPGLNKVARKLQIDCAPAVVGFDFHCGGSHPTFDGYVVCEEFKDTLIAAWEQEQVESARREQEKYDKRVYGNWRKLIKAVLICERLKVRYDFGKTADKVESKNKKNGGKVAVKKRRICSDNESDSG